MFFRHGGVSCSIYLSIYYPHSLVDIIHIFIFMGVIVVFNIPYEKNKKMRAYTQVVDRLCLPMYVFQGLAINIVRVIGADIWIGTILVTLIDAILSVLWITIESRLHR